MKPVVNGLESEYGDQIEFVAINIDDPSSAEAKERFGYRVQPHFFLVDENGDVVQQWLGYNSPNVFEDAFADLLSN